MSDQRFKIPAAFAELLQPCRYKVFYGGRGSGKSTTFGRVLLALAQENPLRVLCAREVQSSLADSVHKLLKDAILEAGLQNFYRVTNTGIYGANGTEFIFRGLRAQTEESMKSLEGIDIVWLEEAQTISDSSLDILIPTIRKDGSELWFSFNPRFRTDAVWQRFVKRTPPGERAIVRKVSWRDNPFISRVLLDEKDDLAASDWDKYQHVWEGELRSFQEGSIYAEQIKQARSDGRIAPLPIVPGSPVHTFWDLGKNDHTAIWFMQENGPWLDLIDYYQDRQQDVDHYARVVKERGYLLGKHHFPHDGEQKRLGMRRTVVQQFEDAGLTPTVSIPRISDIQAGINMTRQLWSRFRFNEPLVEDGLDCLIEYRYKFDPVRGTTLNLPLHNWASNGADALRMIAEGYRSAQAPAPPEDALSKRRREAVRKNRDLRRGPVHIV